MVTSEATDEAGSGGRHGEKPGERERVAGRQENLAGESSVLVVSEGICEASGVVRNPRGDRQGM